MARRDFYFMRSNGELLLLAKNVTEQEAMVIMHAFLDKHNYKSHYTRVVEQPDGLMYDVGSWSEFFYWAVPNDTGA